MDIVSMLTSGPKPGDVVTTNQVVKYAKSRCKTCNGTGTVTFIVPLTKAEKQQQKLEFVDSDVDSSKGHRHSAACSCAMRKFMLAQGDHVTMTKSGELVWSKPEDK